MSLKQRIDKRIQQIDRAGKAPISPFTLVQKMGFQPIISCACGSSIDLNVVKGRARQAWKAEHEQCPPKAGAE